MNVIVVRECYEREEIGGNPVVVKKQGEGVDRQIIIK